MLPVQYALSAPCIVMYVSLRSHWTSDKSLASFWAKAQDGCPASKKVDKLKADCMRTLLPHPKMTSLATSDVQKKVSKETEGDSNSGREPGQLPSDYTNEHIGLCSDTFSVNSNVFNPFKVAQLILNYVKRILQHVVHAVKQLGDEHFVHAKHEGCQETGTFKMK